MTKISKGSQLNKAVKCLYSSRIIRYGIGGWIAACIDLLLLYVFTEYVGIHYLMSQFLAFIGSFFVWFYFQKHITFQKRDGNIWKQWNIFLIFQLGGICINLALMWLLVEKFGIYYLYASILAKGVVFARNYIMNKRYNFT